MNKKMRKSVTMFVPSIQKNSVPDLNDLIPEEDNSLHIDAKRDRSIEKKRVHEVVQKLLKTNNNLDLNNYTRDLNDFK
jgi:allophanate hydrolase subunit 1